MTAQVYFVTSSAQNVINVPIGALTFINQPGAGGAGAQFGGNARPGAVTGSAGPGGAPEGMTDEMRARLRERIASGQGLGGGQLAGRAGQQSTPARRLATVQVANDDGSFEEREIMVGVTSRIAAEVISGLEVGDKVVAGILQGVAGAAGPNGEQTDRREMFRAMGGFR